MHKIIAILAALLLTSTLLSQNSFPQYASPMDIPVYLSATFGELRTNSFHAGIDIKTQGVEGKNIYAVADGYISRIGVSPYGYGNVVYITHHDGYTTVYAHMQRFNDDIAGFVKDYQYAHKTFAANMFPSKSRFPIKKGDFIGLSGNSGGSGGPHLHFEIRHTDSEKPVNAMFFGYRISDDVSPTLNGIAVYPLEMSTVEGENKALYMETIGGNGLYKPEKEHVKANGKIAFGISSYDQVGISTNKNGPFCYELFVNDSLRFKMKCDSFSYSEPKYINSLIDYSHWKKTGRRFVRTEVDSHNRLSMYEMKDGVISIDEGDTISVSYRVSDYKGNMSRVDFFLVGSPVYNVDVAELTRNHYMVKADGSLNSTISIEGMTVKAEKNTFFRDTFVKVDALTDSTLKGCASRTYQYGEWDMTTFKQLKVRIKPDEKWACDKRLYVAHIENGKTSSLGGKLVDGWVETDTRTMGVYVLKIDSISPNITPVNFKNGSDISKLSSLKLKISDDMTGIKSYNIYLNDKWILGQYDAKNKLLYYEIDERMKTGKNNLKVVVRDDVGNEKVYKATLNR